MKKRLTSTAAMPAGMTATISMAAGLILSPGCALVPGLDEAIPDQRKEYRKSEPLPDLEIPPDLTADSINDSMAIPNEKSATLSSFRSAAAGRSGVETGATEDQEQWLAIPGATREIWPDLTGFFTERGYNLELDDAELGVLVTAWSAPAEREGFIHRDRHKIFSEPGADEAGIVLIVSTEAQQRVGASGSQNWIDLERDPTAERLLVAELSGYLTGDTAPPAADGDAAAAAGERPRVLDIDGKPYLAIPDEFTRAWRRTSVVMQQAGMTVTEEDEAKGLYTISYFDETEAGGGFFSKVQFWKDGEPIRYQLNLTGVGNQTELVVLDEDGNWDSSDNAMRIMSLIRERYNAS